MDDTDSSEELIKPEIKTEHSELPAPPHFKSNEILTKQLTAAADKSEQIAGIVPRFMLSPSLYINTDTLPELKSFEDIKDKNVDKITIYYGGIGWLGANKSVNEGVNPPKYSMGNNLLNISQEASSEALHSLEDAVSKSASPEEQAEMKSKKGKPVKEPVLNFLGYSGTDICITLDPKPEADKLKLNPTLKEPTGEEKEVFASSLRADMTAKRAVYQELRDYGTPFEVAAWSNGSFKECRTYEEAFKSISHDFEMALENYPSSEFKQLTNLIDNPVSESDLQTALESILFKVRNDRDNGLLDKVPVNQFNKDAILQDKIFTSGYEAGQYMSLLKDIDIFIGGALNEGRLLATPIKSKNTTPVLREVIGALRATANEALKFGSKTKLNQISNWFVSRSFEMARAKEFSFSKDEKLQFAESASSLLLQIHRGKGRMVFLADTEGSVVESSGMDATKALMNIYTKDLVLSIETRDTGTATVTDKRGSIELSGTSQHGIIKEPGVLQILRQFAIKSRGFSSKEDKVKIENNRFFHVDPFIVEKVLPNKTFLHKKIE